MGTDIAHAPLRWARTLLVCALALVAVGAAPASAREVQRGPSGDARQKLPASSAAFTEALGQLGEWVELQDGARVWRPDGVGDDWQPYSEGSWEWTEVGWYWVSDEPWAWATYHYGRWRFDGRLGWVWVPGTEWGPSWVVWRYGPDVIGWAPRTPDGLLLPAHWKFLPASRFAGRPPGARDFPAGRLPMLLVRSRPAGSDALLASGPLPTAEPYAVLVPGVAPRGPDHRPQVPSREPAMAAAGRTPKAAP